MNVQIDPFCPAVKPALGGGAVAGSAPSEPAPVAKTESTSRTTAACGSKRTCKEMSSCTEAMHHLNNCGLSRLDGDGDGVPCEALCR
ncbi:excalibur calcium-binding domain-containing protein [Allochromatium tepidum]|uniref:excalibur calcium-binding domain-containing protein n=1 Tax=Allochromatium tepidum TaxID=553982 RepID=UPI003AF7C347